MRWSSPGAEALLEDAKARFAGALWPDPPTGFELLGAPRAMRRVLKGRMGDRDVVAKWSRPVTATDHVARALRGGKGPREGRILRRLADRGIPLPRVLGYTDDEVDLLLLEWIEGAEALPAAADLTRAEVEVVSRLLGRAFAAGLRHRDLHRGNVLLVDGEPYLLDLGGARLSSGGGEVRELARLQHGLAGDLSRASRLRALKVWLEEAKVPAIRLGDLVWRVDREARAITRRYRRGRDRRATRSGRHYEVFDMPGGGSGVRRRDTPESWRVALSAWLDSDPPGATPLKEDGRVIRTRLPGREGYVVLKRYEAAAAGRLSRAVRAFRKAVWLEHRGVEAPTPLIALSGPDGASLLVSEHVAQAVDLHLLLEDPDAVSRRERAVLADRLGRFLRAMHDAEISHRDLKAPNLLLAGEPPRFVVADLDGVGRREVDWRRRARDLARLDASLDVGNTDRARVLRAYWRAGPRPPVDRHAFTRWIGRRAAWKRGPSGLAR